MPRAASSRRTCRSASPAGARCATRPSARPSTPARYRWVKKRIERTETVAGGTRRTTTVVYSLGTLYGEWPDGTPFEGNRYVDRYVVQPRPDRADGRVERQRRMAAGARRAGDRMKGECRMRASYLGPLPGHGRFDYRPITRRPRLPLAGRRRAGGLPRLQPRALRLRRGPGRGHRPGVAAARRAELQLARVRQPRRRLALPGAVRPARPAHGGADQHRAVRPLPRAGGGLRGARRRARRPRPHAMPSARACWARPTSASCWRSAASACRRDSGQRAGRLAVAVDLGEPRSRPTCWPRPATATR